MADLEKRLEGLSDSQRRALTKLILIAEKYPDSLAALDKRFDGKAQILRKAFDALCKDGSRRT